MIFHNCIKCDNFEMIPLAEGQLSKMQKFICEKCQTLQWIYHSRIDPRTFAAEDVEVNEETKEIKILREF